MSISNLSNDRGGAGPMNTRPAFLRNDSSPTLLNAVVRYDGAAPADSEANDGGVRLFDGGSAGAIDYKAIAQALMARLDALRDRFEAREAASAADGMSSSQPKLSSGKPGSNGWWHHGRWYSTGTTSSSAPTAPPPASTPTPPPTNNTTNPNPPPASNEVPPNSAPSEPVTPPAAPAAPPSSGTLTPSGAIALGDGAATISDLAITGDTGIVAGNAKHVTTLNVNNVTIRSRNYGIYLGSCDNLNLSNVDIACDPNGGDSYSIRGNIRNFVSSDSTYRAGIKAFRIYGLEGGSSTRDTFTGDRLMLGGGYANEWGEAAPFHNFTFRDGSINVNSVELYNDTNSVVFDNMDFSGTGHISIQAGAHNITFRNCINLPEIRLYDGNGQWTPLPADAARNINVT